MESSDEEVVRRGRRKNVILDEDEEERIDRNPATSTNVADSEDKDQKAGASGNLSSLIMP